MLLTGSSLSACHKQAGSDAAFAYPSASGAVRTEDKFGKGFGKAFRAPPNSEPAKVTDSDVNPVSLTAEPEQVD